MTEEYLLHLVSTLYKRSFFHDLPFMWIRNPDHVLFSHKFDEDYDDEWRRWCMISLSYSQFMEKAHQGYLSKYSWSDVLLHTREALNHAIEHMKRGCFDVLLGCGNQELDRQLSSAIEETRQAMFTHVNDFKKRQNHNTTSQVHTLTLLMNDMMAVEMNRRAHQDLHVNKTEHEITRQQVNRVLVVKDWYAQQPGALDSQSTVQRLSQVVQPLKGTNAKSIGRLGNARKRQIFMSSQSLILSDEEAPALQAVAQQKEHNAPVARQLGRGGTGAAEAAMQWRGGAARSWVFV
ncbi:hypothetical protein CEUSTIGMA_g10622.t1 [Chlamydomonas eustigma]|uniref:Uncharacterized protein n=1 Tax=Chlamydomonas eustigma TaxID=1157962 RepID=A0A250XJK4_9CHLO|nr:hypothetical protein CEUSTIGMA_g10622.t1 [Chlamydomonas eustigma]|eukprot:GAX83196.1 hypothetical protein CEUSTIGMA_g10622.t1 [Chlamydomonas eustigma]